MFFAVLFDRNNVSNSVIAKELVFDEGRYEYTYKKDDLIMFLGEDDLLGVGGLFSPDLTESLMGTGVYEGLFCEIYTVIEKTGLATLTAELKVPAGESIIYKTISAIGISFSRTFIDVDTDKIELSFFLADFDGKFKAVKVTGIESEGEIDEQTVEISIKVLGESSGAGGGGYGDAGTGAYTEKTHNVDLFGQTLSVKYRYTGTDPATVTVKDSNDADVDFWYVVIVNALMQMPGAGYTFSKDLCTLDFQIIEVKVDGQYNFGDDEIRIVGQSRPFYNAGVLVEQYYYFSDGLAFMDIILKNDGTVEVRSERPFVSFGGGGSGGGSLQEQQLYIYDYDWQDMGGTYEATKNINGIDNDSMIWYSAETNSLDDFADAGVVMTEQGYGQVTFSCKEVPQNQISVIVRWQ